MASARDLVQAYYKAFNAKDYPTMVDLVAPKVRHEVNQGGVREGKELFAEFLKENDEAYDETLTDMVFFTEPEGNRIAAEFWVNGIYKKAGADMPPAWGQPYRLRVGAFLEIAEGKITRITTYYNLPNWIDAVTQAAVK